MGYSYTSYFNIRGNYFYGVDTKVSHVSKGLGSEIGATKKIEILGTSAATRKPICSVLLWI